MDDLPLRVGARVRVEEKRQAANAGLLAFPANVVQSLAPSSKIAPIFLPMTAAARFDLFDGELLGIDDRRFRDRDGSHQRMQDDDFHRTVRPPASGPDERPGRPVTATAVLALRNCRLLSVIATLFDGHTNAKSPQSGFIRIRPAGSLCPDRSDYAARTRLPRRSAAWVQEQGPRAALTRRARTAETKC